jgi:hypothetical protein
MEAHVHYLYTQLGFWNELDTLSWYRARSAPPPPL